MDLILPNRSLLIVDKGWLKEKAPSEQLLVGNHAKQRTEGRRTVRDNIAITVMGNALDDSTRSKKPPKASNDSRKRNVPSRSTQNLQFVNATTAAHNRDPEVRKLVRSHARKGSSREEKVRKGPRKEQDTAFIQSSESQKGPDPVPGEAITSPKPSPALSGSTIPLYGGVDFPMKPRFYQLMNCYLEHIAHELYPRESQMIFNPVKTDWFQLAITDEVMLHTTLLAAAMHNSISCGLKTFEEHDLLTERILCQLNHRLANHSDLSDATLGAIGCLAMMENMQGHYDKWEMHMRGMAKIIQIKGGISAIDPVLQMKLCRCTSSADIEGAVDSLSVPQLSPPLRIHPSVYSTIAVGEAGPESNELLAMLISSGVGSRLVAIFHDILRFSYALQYALSSTGVLMHPRSFDEDVVMVQYELLKLQHDNKIGLERALGLGALIYMKSVSRSTPLSPWVSAKATLTRELRSVLEILTDDAPARLLLVWLCFVGGSTSQGPNRAWFIERLVNCLALQARTWTWQDARVALQKVLWVEQLHEECCKSFWDEI